MESVTKGVASVSRGGKRLVLVMIAALTIAGSIGAPSAVAVIARTDAGHYVSYQPTLAGAQHARSLARGVSRSLPRRGSRTLSTATYEPCSSAEAACLTYYGGPVMRTTTLTPVFWNPEGLGLKYPENYEAEIDQFLQGIAADSGGHEDFFSLLTQYYEESGGKRAYVEYSVKTAALQTDNAKLPTGSEECVDPYPKTSRKCVTDSGVQKQLSSFIESKGLPTGLGHEYIVFFPPGMDSCFDAAGTECSGTAYCGYHGTLLLKGGAEQVQYANIPDGADPQFGGCSTEYVIEPRPETEISPAYATASVTSHEISESVTDPEVSNEVLSWYDVNEVETETEGKVETEPYGEVGDMCAWEFKQGQEAGYLIRRIPLESAPASNQTIDGHPYLLQDEWDNAHSTCSVSEKAAGIRARFTDSPAPTAKTGEPVSFNATASSPAGEIVDYKWEWGDGTPSTESTEPITTHVYETTEGQVTKSLSVTLTVTDAEGNTDTTTKTVEVEDRPPVAAFTVPSTVNADSPVQFDGSASSDPDGTVTGYSWDFGDGSTATGATPSHTYAKPGVYTVTLIVTDNAGKTTGISHQITVDDTPPTASFALSNASPVAGQSVAFDGSASSDVDGSALTETWSFGDGTSATGPQAQHVYDRAGAYAVKLTVTDSAGLSASSEQTVTVAAPPNGFRVTAVSRNRKRGTVTLSVAVPWSGVLSAHDAGGAHASGFLTGLIRALSFQVARIDRLHRHGGKGARHGRHGKRAPRSAVTVKAASTDASGTGTVKLVIAPSSAGLRKLAHKHTLPVKLLITFTPTDGEAHSETFPVKLFEQPARRKGKAGGRGKRG